ncbi:MAG: transketolase [Methyloceanibacter sp.]
MLTLQEKSPHSEARPVDAGALAKTAAQLRGKVIEMSHKAQTAHLGSSLSCCDIVTAAYWHVSRVDPKNPLDPLRDRFILSKGHAASTLYAALAMRGFFPLEELDTFCQDGGRLAEHPPANLLPGVEAATGSLGHGLPIGIGMALAGRIKNESYRVHALLSDGECNEGSVWEAAMFAAAHKLENLCIIVDYNKWQATARSNQTLALAPLRDKWEAFGWDAVEIDGHDIGTVARLMDNVPNGSGKPVALVANTIKGKGVSFMEDDNNWHYRAPTAEEVVLARRELGLI